MESDKAAAKALIENFLTAIGNDDINALPEMFSKKANIGGASFRNGEWNTFTMTITEFSDNLKSRSNPKKIHRTDFQIHNPYGYGRVGFLKT